MHINTRNECISINLISPLVHEEKLELISDRSKEGLINKALRLYFQRIILKTGHKTK